MRLFVAVWPPPEVLDAVAALERPPLAHARWTTRDQWHVTLRFLGAMDEPDPVVAALQGTSLPRATVRLGPATRPLGQRVLCLPAAGLEPLADAVRLATADLGEPPEHRRFRGHLTLARLRSGRAGALAGAPFEAGFDVHEVVVVRSELHPHGARYTVVATVPCQGP